MSSEKFTAPAYLMIGGRKIRVILDDDLDDHGMYVHDTKKISINPTKEDPLATLLHEAVHAALAVGGLSEILEDKLEEAVCRAVELIAPNIYFRPTKTK
jgi:hypothetical protein